MMGLHKSSFFYNNLIFFKNHLDPENNLSYILPNNSYQKGNIHGRIG